MSATRSERALIARRSLGLCIGAAALAIFAGCFVAPSPSAAPAPSAAANDSNGSNAELLDVASVGNVKLAEYEGLPTGEQRFGGAPFRIGDSAMRVGSRSFREFPRSVSGVRVGRAFRVARFLHATNGGAFQQPGHPKHELDGVEIGEYVIHYEDGSAEKFPLRYGQEVRDFWNWDRSQPTTNSEVVWNGENPDAAKYGVKVRLYKASWLNPHPDKQVMTIDLVSANAKAAPVCFAITVDDDPAFTPSAPVAPAERPSAAPPVEVASVPREIPTPSRPSAPAESAPSQPIAEQGEPREREQTLYGPPAASAETDNPEADEPPASTDDPPPERTKSTFDLFGTKEDDAQPGEGEGEAPEPIEFLGPPPERWEVFVDPPVALPSYPDELSYKRLDGLPPRRLLAPATPSPFLAWETGASDTEGFRVFDLRSGKEVASIDGLNLLRPVNNAAGPALSPDGRLAAMYDSTSKSIYVGDIGKRKTQNRFSWSDSTAILRFAAPDILVAIESKDDAKVEVWRLPFGAQIASFKLTDQPDARPGLAALSPGGRFLAICLHKSHGESVTFYDLQRGKEVGTLQKQGAEINASFNAFAFSPDGAEFAAYMNAVNNETGREILKKGVVVWDMKTGRPTYRAVFATNVGMGSEFSSSRRPLQWFPDRQGWLISQLHVVDRKEGKIVRSLNEHRQAGVDPTGAQVLDDRRVLISDATTAGMEVIADARSAPAEEDR